MVVFLYLTIICFCACIPTYEHYEKLSMILQMLGCVFFLMANAFYDKTITNLKNEIRDLRKEIDRLKEQSCMEDNRNGKYDI